MHIWLSILFLFPMFAHAEEVVFMVNMNYSQKELDTLKTVTGKRIITVPPESMIADGEALSSMHDSLMANIKKLRPSITNEELQSYIVDIQLNGLEWNEDPDLRKKLAPQIKNYSAASKALWDSEKKLGSIDQQIRAKLKELRSTGTKIQTLCISGHSNGSGYSGETSYNLDTDELNSLQIDHPEMFNDPKHVFLLGCYTMTKTNRLRNRELFPNATLIAGFYLKAPSRKNPMDWEFIQQLITKAKELDQKTLNGIVPNKKAIIDAIKSLSSVNATQSIVDYCHYQIEGVPEKKLSCEEEWAQFQPIEDQFQSEYLSLVNPTKDPPRQTDGTALREFYNQAQNICFEKDNTNLENEEIKDFLDRRQNLIDIAIRTIFWWQIQKNYSTYHAEEIELLRNALKEAEIDIELPALQGKTGRVEFVKKYYQINDYLKEALSENLRKSRHTSSTAQKIELTDKKELLEDAYSKLQDAYEALLDLEKIPLSWHKENAVTEPAKKKIEKPNPTDEEQENEETE